MKQRRIFRRTVLLTLLAMAGPGLPLQAQGWANAPREFPGILDVDLSGDELSLLAKVSLYPPSDQVDSFQEALLVRQLDIRDVALHLGTTVTFDKEKFQRAVRAFDEIKVLRSHPTIKAYEDQVKVVRYYEGLVATATPEIKGEVEAKLQEAKALQARYESQVNTQAPNEIQAAILRRLHRTLSINGFSLPDINVFLQEWPIWVVQFANQNFLTVRLHLRTDAALSEQASLRSIAARYNNFTFHFASLDQLRLVNDTGLTDIDLMSRAQIESTGTGQYDLLFHFTFAGVTAYFRDTPHIKYLPFGFGGQARAKGYDVSIDRFPSLLCLKTSISPDGALTAARCGE